MQTAEATGSPLRKPPGPRSWPLVGNLGIVRGLLPFLEREWSRHGDVFRMHVAGLRAVVVADPDAIHRILVSNRQNYIKGATYNGSRKILGNSLLNLDGEPWKGRRTLAQPAFHRKSLEKLTVSMVESGANYFDTLARSLGDQGQQLDAHRAMVQVTLDVVINALFGSGTISSSEVSYQALNEALELVSAGANGVQLPEWVPTPHNLKFRRTIRSLDGNMYKIIAAARAGDPDSGTLLSMLLAARDSHGEPLPNQAIRDEVITLFIAGHETTAVTLTWLFVLLDGRPEVLQRMQAEVDAVLGARDPTFDDIPKLTYLRQVIDETLRLRPAAPMVARDVVGDDELGGFHVGAGDVVIPFLWAAHRHQAYWSDATRFDPDRFTAAGSKGRHPGSYLPFSSGPRICIGNAFALTETTILVAQMLQRFDIEVQPSGHIKEVVITTARPSQPVGVVFRNRARASRS